MNLPQLRAKFKELFGELCASNNAEWIQRTLVTPSSAPRSTTLESCWNPAHTRPAGSEVLTRASDGGRETGPTITDVIEILESDSDSEADSVREVVPLPKRQRGASSTERSEEQGDGPGYIYFIHCPETRVPPFSHAFKPGRTGGRDKRPEDRDPEKSAYNALEKRMGDYPHNYNATFTMMVPNQRATEKEVLRYLRSRCVKGTLVMKDNTPFKTEKMLTKDVRIPQLYALIVINALLRGASADSCPALELPTPTINHVESGGLLLCLCQEDPPTAGDQASAGFRRRRLFISHSSPQVMESHNKSSKAPNLYRKGRLMPAEPKGTTPAMFYGMPDEVNKGPASIYQVFCEALIKELDAEGFKREDKWKDQWRCENGKKVKFRSDRQIERLPYAMDLRASFEPPTGAGDREALDMAKICFGRVALQSMLQRSYHKEHAASIFKSAVGTAR